MRGAGMVEDEESVPTDIRKRRAGANDFIFAVVAGFVCYLFKLPFLTDLFPRLVWVGITVFGPLLVIVGFAIHGIIEGRMFHADTRQRLADNVYFLGFIFTMMSLIFSFLPVALFGGDIRPQDVYYAFGTGLLATAVGLIGRVLIMQTGATNEETAAKVEEDLNRLAIGVAEEAERILQRLAEARNALGRQSEEVVKAVFAETGPRIRELVLEFESSTASVRDQLKALTAETEASTRALQTRLEARTDDMQAAAAHLVQSRNALSQALDQLRAPAERLAVDLVAVSEASTDAVARLRANLEALGRALEATGQTAARLDAAVEGMTAGLGNLGDRLDRAVRSLETRAGEAGNRISEAASEIEEGVRRASEQASSLTDRARNFEDDVNEAVALFEQAVDRFTTAVERVGREKAGAGADEAA